MARADADVIIFAHQDVYFPKGWEAKLCQAINRLEGNGHRWGILGVWGIDSKGESRGRVWCSASKAEFRSTSPGPAEVETIDEAVIVLNRACGVHFDKHLPGYHLYGTDLVLQTRKRGFKTFVFDAPVVHNSLPAPRLYDSLAPSYRYLQQKWSLQLPVRTCVVPLTRHGWEFRKRRFTAAVNRRL